MSKKKCCKPCQKFQSIDILQTCEGRVIIEGLWKPTHKGAIKSKNRTAKLYMDGEQWGGPN